MKTAKNKPYFVRFLEPQELSGVQGGRTLKYPSDADEEVTLKYPSDGDDDGPVA